MVYDSYAEEVKEIYSRLDEQIREMKKLTGLSCPKACGVCCSKENIEATALEFLPLSLHLWETGEAFSWYKILQKEDLNNTCVFYKSQLSDNDTGACMMYFYRPLVCRLFSNAAVINKYEKAEISLCRILSGSRPELKEHIQKAMGMGLSVPVMRNYSMMIYNIHPELGGKYYPINTAFKKSLEIVSLSPKNFSNNRAA